MAGFLPMMVRAVSLLVVVFMMLPVSAWGGAQLPTATILGRVTDASGAVVPGANVTAHNTETGQTRTTIAGEDGSYRLSALPVGGYQVKVEFSGFQTAVRSGVTLTVAQEAVLNFTLAVGAAGQTIAVTAEAPLVNTTSGALGGLVSEQQVSDLPLNGRNYVDLTFLNPGVTLHSRHGDTAGATGTWFSSSGAPLRSNNFLLDGASMATLWGASSAAIGNTTLGVEGIREFRVVTNAFSAEYGMTMGSQLLIVSKNGTNEFHGSLFEYHRNSALDARNFFDYKTIADQRRLPSFIRHQYGGSIGGPIKKDKTFFHGVYESLRERLGVTNISNVMPAACHTANGIVDSRCVPTLAPGQTLAVAPIIRPILAVFPEPNLPNNQYTYPFKQPIGEHYAQTRIDQTISANDTLFGRYTIDDGEKITNVNYPQRREPRTSRYQFLTLSDTHIISPTVLNTFRISFSRTKLKADTFSGIIGPDVSAVAGKEIGNITVTGFTGFSGDNASPSHHKQNIYAFSDDLFYTAGRHSLKFGALVNRYQVYTKISLNDRSNMGFASLTDFLSARVNNLSVATPGSRQERYYEYSTFGLYAQDDLRLASNLTLNLGLRYEFLTVPQESSGLGASLRDRLRDDSTTVGPALLGKNPSLKNWGPRVGFAWDVNGKGMTSVRGAFALLYDLNGHMGTAMLSQAGSTPPFSGISSLTQFPLTSLPVVVSSEAFGKVIRGPDYYLKQPHILHYNFSVQRQLPAQLGVTLAYAGSRGFNLVTEKDGNPTLPSQVLSDGRKFWTGAEPRLNPNWGYIRLNAASSSSWYNSLQFTVQKNVSRGLTFQSSYTYSKIVDETQGVVPADSSGDLAPTDPLDRSRDRARAAFDVPHNWHFNAMYRFPSMSSGGVAGALLNGWWMSSIVGLQSGYYFSPTLTRNRSRSKSNDSGPDRPDLVPGIRHEEITRGASRGCGSIASGTPVGTPEMWFDPCAFRIQPVGFLGNAGRNILAGPGLANVDFSMGKELPMRFLGEGGKVEFRAEVFNLANRANFDLPNQTVYTGAADTENPVTNVGRIVRTRTTSRQIQLALKVLF